MDDVYKFWREFGFQAAALVALAWFFRHDVWPLIKSSVERWLAIAEKDRTALLDSLARRDAELTALNGLVNGLVLEALASTRAVISENRLVIVDHTQAIRELVSLVRLDSQRHRHSRAGDDIAESHG